MKTLHLVLKKKWYDMIDSGVKTEEYRDFKPYWEKRLLDYKAVVDYYEKHKIELNIKLFFFPSHPVIENACASFPRGYEAVTFHLGYTRTCMTFRCDGIDQGFGRPEWGAPKDTPVFIIKIGERMN